MTKSIYNREQLAVEARRLAKEAKAIRWSWAIEISETVRLVVCCETRDGIVDQTMAL